MRRKQCISYQLIKANISEEQINFSPPSYCIANALDQIGHGQENYQSQFLSLSLEFFSLFTRGIQLFLTAGFEIYSRPTHALSLSFPPFPSPLPHPSPSPSSVSFYPLSYSPLPSPSSLPLLSSPLLSSPSPFPFPFPSPPLTVTQKS